MCVVTVKLSNVRVNRFREREEKGSFNEVDWGCALPKKATYYGNMHRNGKGGGRSDWTWVIAETNSLWLHNEESFACAVKQRLQLTSYLIKVTFQAQKVMIGYSNEYKVDMLLCSKIGFDRCQLNRKNCGYKLSLVRIRFGSELSWWNSHCHGIWTEVRYKAEFDIAISHYSHFYSCQLSDVRIFFMLSPIFNIDPYELPMQW